MDYETKVSTLLNVGSAANCHKAVAMGTRMQKGLHPTMPRKKGDEKYDPVTFTVEDDGHGSIWIHDDSQASMGDIADFVIACAQRFNLQGMWSFEASCDASRPTTDAYGGYFALIDLSKREVMQYGGTRQSVDTAIAGLKLREADGPLWAKLAIDAALQAAENEYGPMSERTIDEMTMLLGEAFSTARAAKPSESDTKIIESQNVEAGL